MKARTLLLNSEIERVFVRSVRQEEEEEKVFFQAALKMQTWGLH